MEQKEKKIAPFLFFVKMLFRFVQDQLNLNKFFFRLQDFRCLWCREMVHPGCKSQIGLKCPVGKISVVPPTALHTIGSDDAWEASRPLLGCSPLLVFVNSKSGDHQGLKFLRRFKQLLNPGIYFCMHDFIFFLFCYVSAYQ